MSENTTKPESMAQLCLNKHQSPDMSKPFVCELFKGHDGPHKQDSMHCMWDEKTVWVSPWNDERGHGLKKTRGFGQGILGI